MRVVDERGYEKRNATYQVPHEAKCAKGVFAQMHQLMDEKRRPVIKQRGYQKECELQGRPERRFADQPETDDPRRPTEQKIGPVNERIGFEQIADQTARLGHGEGP